MEAYVIYIQGHEDSEKFSDRCVQSIIDTESELTVEKFPAITPENMWQVNYTWPLRKKKLCEKTKLLLSAYKTYDNNKRIAAAQSHYMLWRKCATLNRPILILEHDAIFIKKFDMKIMDWWPGEGAVSINDPIGATFSAKEYDRALEEGINEVPWLADKNIPQGLPGHSAYVLYPDAAREIMRLQEEIGWWPNDAIMCKQLCPWIRSYKPYITKCQGIKSTTSK
tara:strand:+ start:7917 stop:8588 length:672 start_codon:yes stop_codon:yes gene_type:complete